MRSLRDFLRGLCVKIHLNREGRKVFRKVRQANLYKHVNIDETFFFRPCRIEYISLGLIIDRRYLISESRA